MVKLPIFVFVWIFGGMLFSMIFGPKYATASWAASFALGVICQILSKEKIE
jgi:O-antigen/teichoic acid export membrane protein